MDCKHAYLMRGIDYVLCDFDPRPNPKNKRDVCHAMCAHQKYCGSIMRCALLPSWIECARLHVVPQNAPESTDFIPVKEIDEKKKNRKKREETVVDNKSEE